MSDVITLPKSFSRTSARPVDRESLFASYADLLTYATSPIAYPGQIVSVSATNLAYIINDDFSVQPFAFQGSSDGKYLPLSGGFVTGNIISNSSISANQINVDNIEIEGNTISITNSNGDLTLSPNGNGEVNISKVDIDGGTLDGVTIGSTTPATSIVTNILDVDNIRIDGNIISSTSGNISLQPSSNLTIAIGNLSASDTITGNIINGVTGFRVNNGATLGHVLRGNGTNFVSATLNAADLSQPKALNKFNDSNVTLTLTGTPGTALLQDVGLVLGWDGQLPITRGGTGSNDGSITGSGELTFAAGGTDQNINLTPSGNGEVNITNVDIDSGTIDGTTIGLTTPAEGQFTNLHATGNVSIDGNLFVAGSSTTINTVDLVIRDPIIYLAEGNEGDVVDMGFTVAYNYNLDPRRHAGFLRNNIDKKWVLFSNLSAEVLSATNIDFNDPSLVIDTLKANIEGTLTGNVSGIAAQAVKFVTGRTISTTGDIIYTSGALDGTANVTGVATISSNVVNYSKIQKVSANKILGNPTGSAADVSEIDCTSAGRALLDDATAADQRNTLGVGAAQSVTFADVTVNNANNKSVLSRVYNGTVTGNNTFTLTTFPSADYFSAKYTVQIKDTNSSERCALEIIATNNNGTWEGTVYGIVDPGTVFTNVDIGLANNTVNLEFTFNGVSNYSVIAYTQAFND